MEVAQVKWVGSSLKDLRDFPEDAKDEVGHALQKAQYGFMPTNADPLHGFGGASVAAIKADSSDGCTYRLVYTTRFAAWIYCLHAWQKKSAHGIATSQHDIELIKSRLQLAATHYEEVIRTRKD